VHLTLDKVLKKWVAQNWNIRKANGFPQSRKPDGNHGK